MSVLLMVQDAATTAEVNATDLFRLIQLILAAVGGFIVRVGFMMVKSINNNTEAVRSLAVNIGQLVKQHEEQEEASRKQVQDSTAMVMEAVERGFNDVRAELAKQDTRGPSGSA